MGNIRLAGEVVSAPQYSNTCKGEDIYLVKIKSKRLSDVYDTITCFIPELFVKDIIEGENICIEGDLRSRNNEGKLDIYVFVKEICEYERDENRVYLDIAYVCKKPLYRKTPNGREISDILVAINRTNSNKSDYIPCIAWGRNAMYAAELEVSNKISVCGRFQSREYVKHLEDGTQETRVAYELSISSFDEVEE